MRDIPKSVTEQVDWSRIIEAYTPLHVRYPQGELIYQAGTYAAGAYLITDGLVGDQCTPPRKTRQRLPLEILGPGDLIGLEILLKDSANLYLSCARAITETDLLFFEREVFLDILKEEEVNRHCLDGLSQRLYSLKRWSASLFYASVEERLCRLLLDLANRYGKSEGERIRLLPPEITRATLAQLLGVSEAKIKRAISLLPEVSSSGRIALSPEALHLWLTDRSRTS
jgi:CRP-like cAMP-binding protein